MLKNLTDKRSGNATPIEVHSPRSLRRWLPSASKRTQQWIKETNFRAESGQACLVPNRDGGVERVLVGTTDSSVWSLANLPASLPKGRYRLTNTDDVRSAERAVLGWALGCYRFGRYRKVSMPAPILAWPDGVDQGRVTRLAEAIAQTRDLINTPASDLGPEELAQAAKDVATKHRAKTKIITGAQLLSQGYPAIHAVGRASPRAPRLVDLTWGAPNAPKLTLVGKGVCFDSGGLDIKTAAGMKLMKKDMGGAALVLGLAHAVMDANLPVRLRVLVPAVENSVAGNAMRPLDVLNTRKGLSVEVGNTDAEGRLILCDALAEADSEKPSLILDAATLTGAARVALGTALPALFANSDDWAEAILGAGIEQEDPLWRLPLHREYRPMLESPVADLNNVSSGGYGGAITAALFLSEFVRAKQPWVHIDTMAYNLDSKPGRPQGGEAFGLRAIYAALEARWG